MTTDARHSKASPTNIGVHVVQAWTYADSTARLAATGFTAEDVGKAAEQQSDETWWLLTNHSPITWKDITSVGTGEANTASNVGTAGVGVFKQKTGVDLEFKKVNAGSSKVSITDDTGNDEVDIDVVEASLDHANIGNVTSDQHHARQHALGAAADHTSATLAQLNALVSDATLDDSGDSRTPSGAASGDLGGTYPSPTVNDGADSTAIHDNIAGEIAVITAKATPTTSDFLVIEDAGAANAKASITIGDLPAAAPASHASTHEPGGGDAMTVDAAVATGSLRTLGTGAQQACAGDDSRLSDARTPTSHASTHQNGGGDEISVAGLSGLLADAQTPTAHQSTHNSGGSDALKLDDLATPDDNTDLDSSLTEHGLLPKLGGGTTNFLRADGTWAAPPAASTAIAIWGDDGIATSTTVRYLTPGYDDSVAETAMTSYRMPRAGTVQNMRVRANTAGTGAATLTYTFMVNGSPTSLAVAMSNTVQDGSDLSNTASVSAGDLVGIRVEKSTSISTSPDNLVASVEVV